MIYVYQICPVLYAGADWALWVETGWGAEEEGRKLLIHGGIWYVSVSPVFSKLEVGSRGLVKFRFSFSGKISLLVMLGSFFCITS